MKTFFLSIARKKSKTSLYNYRAFPEKPLSQTLFFQSQGSKSHLTLLSSLGSKMEHADEFSRLTKLSSALNSYVCQIKIRF